MPSRFATVFLIAACAAVALCLPSVALAAEPGSGFLGAEVARSSSLSLGELAGLIAIGFLPALVMIARERRAERRGG
jgi:hypothetical protein